MPPRPPKSLTRGRWSAIALSLFVHACIVAAAVFGWFSWKHTPPETATLAIDATLVDERTLKGIPPAPEPAPPVPEPIPEPAPVEELGPPKPDPAELERKQEEERLAAEKLEQEKVEQQKREQEDKVVQERLEAEKQEAARVAAQKVAAEKAAADKKALEKQRVDDAAAAKKAAAEKVRLAREAELRRALEAEEHSNEVRNSDAAARWHAQIVARIERAWIRPPSAQPGIECIVSVTQVPGGEVTGVKVDSCTGGGEAMSQSVNDAVLRASPLPSPPDPALFERVLILTFKPD